MPGPCSLMDGLNWNRIQSGLGCCDYSGSSSAMQKMDIVSARCAEPKAVLTVLANTPLDQSFSCIYCLWECCQWCICLVCHLKNCHLADWNHPSWGSQAMEMVKLSGSFMKRFMVRAYSLIRTNWNRAAGSVRTQTFAIAASIHYCNQIGRRPTAKDCLGGKAPCVSMRRWLAWKTVTPANSWPVCLSEGRHIL